MFGVLVMLVVVVVALSGAGEYTTRLLEGDREEEGVQRIALLDSCPHPSNEAVEAVEEPHVRAVRMRSSCP
jgi:hypothetical protein